MSKIKKSELFDLCNMILDWSESRFQHRPDSEEAKIFYVDGNFPKFVTRAARIIYENIEIVIDPNIGGIVDDRHNMKVICIPRFESLVREEIARTIKADTNDQ